MNLYTILFAYIFGGLTFLPLVTAAVVILAWRSLPKAEVGAKEGDGEELDKLGQVRDYAVSASDEHGEQAASGMFAVLRKYDFQTASAALNARNSTGTGGAAYTGDGIEEPTSTGESVYQSVYRSVFDRNKYSASATSILKPEEHPASTTSGKSRKAVTPVNVFYIVLRHGHLMLYDSPTQVEVRHVISLAHHTISLSGGESEEEVDMQDGDLFIKRTAIVLTPNTSDIVVNGADGDLQALPPKRPFFLFSPICIEKEDFYHALLSTGTRPPIPQPLDTSGIIKLQSTLHSTNSLTAETRAFNALISRLFLALHHTDHLRSMIKRKIEKKISRVQKPAFIASLTVRSIDLGDAAPVLTNPRLRDLNISGDMTVACDLRYTGGLKVTVSALARLDLGSRFKSRTADLLLSTSVTRLHGHVLLRVKPPPSNRLWFCFETMPDMEVMVEPVVQSRQITYTFILRAIEDRIRSVIGDTLVKPNWDDLTFFDSRGQSVRGGIWLKQEDPKEEEVAADHLKETNAKTKSMPSLLPNDIIEAESSAASSGSESAPKLASAATGLDKDPKTGLKRRSIASLPAEERDLEATSSLHSKPLRSPSLASPAASVASIQLDESPANSEPAQLDSQSRGWRLRPMARQSASRKEAIETMREMRDRAMQDRGTEEQENSRGADEAGSQPENVGTRRLSDSTLDSRSESTPDRTYTGLSAKTISSTTSARSQRQQEAVQRGKTFLLAAGAATNAARNWSWNAIQNRTKGQRSIGDDTQKEPVGRGQPLPPPGMPLPGPSKSWLPSSAGMGSVKRKPVPALPTRHNALVDQKAEEKTLSRGSSETTEYAEQDSMDDITANGSELVGSPTSDDFGPWRENSGAGLEGLEDRGEDQAKLDTIEFHKRDSTPAPTLSSRGKKVPPPLPARPKVQHEGSPLDDVSHPSAIEALDNYESSGEDMLEFDADVGSAHDGGAEISADQSREPAPGSKSAGDFGSLSHGGDPIEHVAISAPVNCGPAEDGLEVEGLQTVWDPAATQDRTANLDSPSNPGDATSTNDMHMQDDHML